MAVEAEEAEAGGRLSHFDQPLTGLQSFDNLGKTWIERAPESGVCHIAESYPDDFCLGPRAPSPLRKILILADDHGAHRNGMRPDGVIRRS